MKSIKPIYFSTIYSTEIVISHGGDASNLQKQNFCISTGYRKKILKIHKNGNSSPDRTLPDISNSNYFLFSYRILLFYIDISIQRKKHEIFIKVKYDIPENEQKLWHHASYIEYDARCTMHTSFLKELTTDQK